MAKGVQCKDCAHLFRGWCEVVTDFQSHDSVRDCEYFRKKTNADVIRAMTNDELAAFLDDFSAKCMVCADCDGENNYCLVHKQGQRYCSQDDIKEFLEKEEK